MKIGILSMQKIHNYGSVLQAFSLKRNLEELGHDVYFIDIEKGRKIVPDIPSAKLSFYLKKLDKYIFKRIEHYFLAKQMNKMYVNFQNEYLETYKSLPEGDSYDVVIIGSDEVFNCASPSPWGFTPQLFGEISNTGKVVTYAASCGSIDYKKVCALGIEHEISTALSKLSYISVRDENTADFVKSVCGRDSEINLDPVFIYDFDKYIPNKLDRKKYIIVYAYTNRIDNESEISSIKKFAKVKGLDIISVGQYQKWCPINLAADPFQLLEYIKNAEYIITDTFHGNVFSIKYNKKYCTFIRNSNYNKIYDLLQKFNLESQLITKPEDIPQVIENDINYVAINAIINNEKDHFKEYINKCLNMNYN